MKLRTLLGITAGITMLAGAGAANAETTFSGNVAIGSDYMFRGVSQSDNDIAVSGGFDVASGIFYAGAWASSIDFGLDGTVETDIYAGVKPVLGPVTLDVGLVGYFYPGMDADAAEADYIEGKLAATVAPIEGLSITGAVFYSPDFTFTAGDDSGLYAELSGGYTINKYIAVSGAVGNQSVDVTNYYGAGDDSYTTWNLGATASVAGFGIDLRYFDTDVDLVGPSGDKISDGRAVLTIKRAL